MYALAVMWTMVACEPTTSSSPLPVVEDTELPSEAPACPDVCWTWEPQPVPTGCNSGGMQPGVCPSGFTCQAVEAEGGGGTEERCVGDGGPYHLSVDLDLLREPLHRVQLQWTAGGSLWTTSPGGVELQASFVGVRRGLVAQAALSADGAPMELQLISDTYRVSIDSKYPLSDDWIPLQGELVVEGAGSVMIEMPIRHVGIALTVDGVAMSEVPPGGHLSAMWSTSAGSAHGGRDGGLPKVWLPDGLYDLRIYLSGSGWPGFGEINTVCEVTRAAAPCEVDVRGAFMSGRVTLNGGPLPAGAAGFVAYGDEDLPVQSDGTFSGNVLDNGYQPVLFFGQRGDEYWFPSGGLVMDPSERPHTEMMFDLRTTRVSGSVDLYGESPRYSLPFSDNMGITFSRSDGTSLSIPLLSDGTFNGLLWAGKYDVVLNWNNQGSDCTFPLGRYDTNGPPPLFEAPFRRVTIAMTIDGAAPFSDEQANVDWHFSQVGVEEDPGSCVATKFGTYDPLRMETWLPVSKWDIIASDEYGIVFDGIEYRELNFGELDMSNQTTQQVDLRTEEITIDLRLDGETILPSPRYGRGVISIGASSAALPVDQPGRVVLRALPGAHDVRWTCDVDCEIYGVAFDVDSMLWSGIDY